MKNIVLVGSGNVATNLGLSLKNNGYVITQVWSKKLKHANILAKKLNSTSTNNLNELKDADLYVVAVKDDSLESLTLQLNVNNIVHTSGSLGLEIFKKKTGNYGVFYPLQTFNKNINLDLSKTPICIESNNKLFENKLVNLGNDLSEQVIKMSSEKREKLHIAAVFASNFTNHMFSIADSILAEAHIDFKLLLPLINQTVKKISQNKPSIMQTGPAKRKDQRIIQNHINKLSNKELKGIYQIISNSIIKNNE